MKNKIKFAIPVINTALIFAGCAALYNTYVTWVEQGKFFLSLAAVTLLCGFAGFFLSYSGKGSKKRNIISAVLGAGIAEAIFWGCTIVINAVIGKGQLNDLAGNIAVAAIIVLYGIVSVLTYKNLNTDKQKSVKALSALLIAAMAFVLVMPSFPYIGIALGDKLDEMIAAKENPGSLDRYEFTFSGEDGTVPNFASNMNIWFRVKDLLDNSELNESNNVFDFVEYIQLMTATGGEEVRDLFKDPLDRSVRDDYDFTRLIEDCRAIVEHGAKPHVKTGAVPLKLTTDPIFGAYAVNTNPPDDYNEYYDYIFALTTALVEEFGREEVASWRFGVLTEYDNSCWFKAKDENPKNNIEAYEKLYDYTVKALQDVLGKDIFVSAHSMNVGDEDFIRHCAEGTNYATGEKGTLISGLDVSYYIESPGKPITVDLGDKIGETKRIAEKYGLTNLEYGVAEGRVLNGADGEGIDSRSVGYTWMGAFDASLYARLWENGCHYLSVWDYLSDELFAGNPLIDYHVARLMSQFKGSTKLLSESSKGVHLTSAEVKAFGAYDKENNTLRAFAYNFKNSYQYKRNADITLNFDVPEMADGQVKVTLYRCDDDCNWYDEWRADWEKYGITGDMFSWSSDDGLTRHLEDENARKIYETELRDKYAECSVLTPETYTAEVKNGKLTLNTQVEANTVVFFEIAK